MLEIRYNEATKVITGWWSRFGNTDRKLQNRPDEAIVMLDIPIPDKVLKALLFDGVKLIPNPTFVEPEPVRDDSAEIDKLWEEVRKLKEGN